MYTPLNIIGGWYSDEALPWTKQDICNYIPVFAEQPGTLSRVKALDAPGLKPFVEIASNGGIRGAENVEEKLLVVAGTTLYQISNTGVAIPRGTIPGTGLVSIGYNQQGIANEVLIGNGSAGYVYNTSLLTLERVTDEAFPGTKAVDYLDSYLLGVEPLGRFWFHSDLADAESYNSLDRYEAETSPDPIVTLAVSNEEVVVFGQRTTDLFVNTGATTGTFQSKGVAMSVGCAAARSVVKLDNTLFWLDNFGVFQRLNGYSPQPVSTRVLEAAISGLDWTRCRGMVYQDKGRKIVYWTFPGELTIGYDVTTGLWHRREAYGINSDRLSCIVAWNNKWIGGDYISGRLYELDWDYMLQVDQPHVRKLKTAPLAADRKRVRLNMAELVFDTGGPETIAIPFPAQPEGPTLFAPPLPDGSIGLPWAGGTYTATGGTPPYTFTSRPGTSFPGNLGPMSPAGVVPAETPTSTGNGVNIVRVTDANLLYDELTDNFQITSAMLLTGTQSASSMPSAEFSSTASSWTPITDAVMPLSGAGSGYGAGRWVCVINDDGYYSDNLAAWAQCAAVPSNGGLVVTVGHGNGVFLAVGSAGLIYRSTDNGVNFATVTDVASNYVCASYGNGRWIAGVGSEITGPYRTSTDDGVTWSQGTAVFPYQVSCARYNGERWAIGGGQSNPALAGGIRTSTDGATWGSSLATPSRVESVTYGNGIWVALCYSGEILYSDDDWVTFSTSATTVSATGGCDQVVYNGFVFVLVDPNGFSPAFTRTSVDGNTWTAPVATVLEDNLSIVSSYEYG